jgi:hypothetical protein
MCGVYECVCSTINKTIYFAYNVSVIMTVCTYYILHIHMSCV